MHYLGTLELAVRADKTTHSWRVVIVQLKLYPHLPMSTVHAALAACDTRSSDTRPCDTRSCDTRPRFLFVAGADASSLLVPFCVPRIAARDFPFSFPFPFADSCSMSSTCA